MRRKFLVVVAGSLSALALVACGKSGSKGDGSGELFLPPAGFVADAARGKVLFDKFCSRCHGAGGKGTDQGPPLVHIVYEPNHHGDMAFYMAVKKGVRHHHWNFGDMPPVAGVTASEAGHIIAYVRRQQRLAGIGGR